MICVHAANKSASYITEHLIAPSLIPIILSLVATSNQPRFKFLRQLQSWPHVMYPKRFNQKIEISTACFWPLLHVAQFNHRGKAPSLNTNSDSTLCQVYESMKLNLSFNIPIGCMIYSDRIGYRFLQIWVWLKAELTYWPSFLLCTPHMTTLHYWVL